jgi:hypothetical protein
MPGIMNGHSRLDVGLAEFKLGRTTTNYQQINVH